MQNSLERFYPLREVPVTTRDPPFITPEIKFLLRWKNKLLRSGGTDEAKNRENDLSSKELQHTNPRNSTRLLWEKVRQLTQRTGD